MLPTTIILCSLAVSTPPTIPPELLERRQWYFDDMMYGDYVPGVIGRLEEQLAKAKKNGRPKSEIDDIEKALEAWRKGGSLAPRSSRETLPAKPAAKPAPPPARADVDGIAVLQLVIAQAKARGESPSTVDYYQKLFDELLAKQPKR